MVDQLCVIFAGKSLGDADTLTDSGVYDGATLHLVIQSTHHVCYEANLLLLLALFCWFGSFIAKGHHSEGCPSLQWPITIFWVHYSEGPP